MESPEQESNQDSDEEPEYEVDRILAERLEDGFTLYLVRWKGYEDYECTWEPAESFNTPETLEGWVCARDHGDVLDEDILADLQSRMDAFQAQQQTEQQPISSGENYITNDKRLSPELPAKKAKMSNSGEGTTRTPDTQGKFIDRAGKTPSHLQDNPNTRLGRLKKQKVDSTPTKKGIAMSVNGRGKLPTPVGGQFRNLSHQNNYRKRAREEAAIKPTSLKLISPAQIPMPGETDTAHILPASINAVACNQTESFLFFPDRSETELQSNQLTSTTSQSLSLSPNTEPTLPFTNSRDIATSLSPTQEIGKASKPTTNMSTKAKHNTSESPPVKPSKDNQSQTVKGINGREWIKGDLVVSLSMGKLVGTVKFAYLPWHPFCQSLSELKEGMTPKINFAPEDLITKASFDHLISGHPQPYVKVTGLIEGFSDTFKAIDELCDYLEKHDFAGLWSHPHGKDMSMLLYSCQAQSWHILGRRIARTGQPPSRLHIAILPRLNHQATEHKRLNSIRSSHDHDTHRADSKVSSEASKHISNFSKSQYAYWLEYFGKESIIPELSLDFQSLINFIPANTAAANHDTRFYITFSTQYPREAALLARWLQVHTRNDCISEGSNHSAWARIKGTAAMIPVIIFFHSDHPCYYQMEGFGEAMNIAHVVCFSLKFGTYTAGTKFAVNATKYFPRKSVFLVTEDTIVRQPEQALFIVRFFQKAKREGWKIVFRPRIQAWIKATVNAESDKRRQNNLLEILAQIEQLYSEHKSLASLTSASTSSADIDERTEGSHIISHASLPHYQDDSQTKEAVRRRDAILTDWFCGFAAIKASTYRRFWIFSKDKNIPNSGHVYIEDPDKFVKHQREKKVN